MPSKLLALCSVGVVRIHKRPESDLSEKIFETSHVSEVGHADDHRLFSFEGQMAYAFDLMQPSAFGNILMLYKPRHHRE
jgi:hypothetical protein